MPPERGSAKQSNLSKLSVTPFKPRNVAVRGNLPYFKSAYSYFKRVRACPRRHGFFTL
jgi:hypothetical protein